MSNPLFEAWPKIPRQDKTEICVTEKIDGTNAQINIVPTNSIPSDHIEYALYKFNVDGVYYSMFAGSRKRYLRLDDDNFCFAMWVVENAEELSKLGPGRHFGEWYGSGIQRGYGLGSKRLALFNVAMWGEHNPNTPSCCEVVPTLGTFSLEELDVTTIMTRLKAEGSRAVPGYFNPEGIILFNRHSKTYTKHTYEHTEGKYKKCTINQ